MTGATPDAGTDGNAERRLAAITDLAVLADNDMAALWRQVSNADEARTPCRTFCRR